MEITAGMSNFSAKITSVAPGGLCFALGVALGAYGLFSKLSTTSETTKTPIETPVILQQVAPADVPSEHKMKARAGDNPSPNRTRANLPAKSTASVDQEKLLVEHSKVVFDYLGPNGATISQAPLSRQLRVALNEIYFCEQSTFEPHSATCKQAFNRKFRRLPSAEDLEDIERVERDRASLIVEERVKADKEYEILSRTYQK
jgi:hypothetical protein